MSLSDEANSLYSTKPQLYLRPYILLIKSRLPPSNLAPITACLGVTLALIPASILAQSNWLVFAGHVTLSVLSMLAVALCCYLYNDMTDIETDRVNRLNRPLVTGEASKENVRNLVLLLGAMGLVTAFTINLQTFLFMSMYFALCFLYSFPGTRLKRIFIIKDLMIGTGYAITYLMGGSVVGKIPPSIYLLATFGFVATITSNIVKDFEHIEGDKIDKVKTIPIVWGPSTTIKLVMALIFSSGIATVVGYLHLGFHIAFTILAICAFTAILYVLYPLLRHCNEPSYLVNTYSLVKKKMAPINLFLLILTTVGAGLLNG